MNRAVIIAFVFVFLGVSRAEALDRTWDESTINRVSGVYERDFVLAPGEQYKFWTSDLVPKGCSGYVGDPVMHVWDMLSNTWLGSNDDCSGSPTSSPNSCVTINVPPGTAYVARVVVHGYSTCTDSEGRFHAQGYLINNDPNELGRFGGMRLDSVSDDIGWLINDRIHAVRSPNSITPAATFRMYATTYAPACGVNDIKLLSIGTEVIQLPTASIGNCTSGSPIRHRLVLGSSALTDANREARIYVNDVLLGDTDGDGLGNALETALGTCRQTGGSNCSYATTPKDTDHDGIEDGPELLGIMAGDLRLPAWGSNPRHKDVFVELDYGTGVTPSIQTSTATAIANAFIGGTAANAGNPDGLAGFRVHIDGGTTSLNCPGHGTDCSTTYGDWGGSSAVSSTNYSTSSTSDMATNRRGLFFHGLILAGGNARSTDWAFFAGRGTSESAFTRNLTHALGLALGATRWGNASMLPLDCKPSYRSVMNYGYANLATPQFSTGSGPTLTSTDLNESTPPSGLDTTKLNQGFGVSTIGSGIDWNRDGSLNSSVKAVTRWATGGIRDCNVSTVHPTTESIYLHDVHSPGITDFGWVNDESVELPIPGEDPPDLPEATPRISQLYVDKDQRMFARTAKRPVICTEPGNPAGCCEVGNNASCTNFGASAFVDDNVSSSPAMVAEEPYSGGVHFAVPRTVVIYTKYTGSSRQAFARRQIGELTYSAPVALDLPVWPFGPDRKDDGALVDRGLYGNENLFYYFIGESNRVFRAVIGASKPYINGFPAFNVYRYQELKNSATNPLVAIASEAAPTAISLGGETYFITTTSTGVLEVWHDNVDTNGTATKVSGIFPAQSVLANVGHPSMAFSESMRGDAVHIFYPSGTSGTQSNLWGAWSIGNWINGPTPFLTDGRMYASSERGAFSVGPTNQLLVFNQSTDNMLEMTSSVSSGAQRILQFAPFASGVFPFPESDANDFGTFAGALCARLRAGSSCIAACGSSAGCSGPQQSQLSFLP